MKIIFDFDHTLFSVKKLYNALENNFQKIGINKKLFKETFEKAAKEKPYNPEKQFQLIIEHNPEVSLKLLRENFKNVLHRANTFLYPDVENFFKKAEKNIDLFLVSYGDKKFQRAKIENAGIVQFFEKIIITSDINKVSVLKKLLKKNEKAIFVDDNPETLSAVKKEFPQIITIRMKRREGKYQKEKDNPNIDFSINNLKELEKILFQYENI